MHGRCAWRYLAWLALMACGPACAALAPQAAYQLHCMGCHGANGSGDATRVPSVNQAMLRFAATAEGRNYLIRVPGIATSPLSDADLTALLNWMLKDFGTPSAAPPADFSIAEVADARRHPLADVAAARLRVLARKWP
jgi:mono/diheme cytochrome c family protein